MAEKRVSVRLAAVGGRQVRAELEGVGEAGSRSFGRLSREMEAANTRMAGFSRKVGMAAAATVAAATAPGIAMVRSGLQTVDAQAKLAQSLGTTVASIQTLERSGELAGVSMSGIEQATKDLTRRLSQAAAGSGPASDALERLGLTAGELLALPLDQRVGAINAAIEAFVPVAKRAAVAGQLFVEEGSIAIPPDPAVARTARHRAGHRQPDPGRGAGRAVERGSDLAADPGSRSRHPLQLAHRSCPPSGQQRDLHRPQFHT